MRRLYLLAIVVAFVFPRAQAMASPPVSPPPEGFVITTQTNITGDGTVTESEKFNWRYFEGVGNIGAETLAMRCQGRPPGDPDCVFVEPPLSDDFPYMARYIVKQGFQEGAEIAYQQDYLGIDGKTVFIKNFKADSHNAPNLTVDKLIAFEASAGGKGYATHLEKVGLSVVSQGGQLDSGVGGSVANGLLSLCPWTAPVNRDTTNNGCGGCGCPGANGCDSLTNRGCDYPATNEGIAAGSSFKVTNITGFTSNTSVTSTDVPALSYSVWAPDGKGTISAGFVVQLWEGQTCWGQRDMNVYIDCCDCEPSGLMIQNPVPVVASRVQYAENATADGVWSFTKKVKYQSVMPAGASSSGTTFPFNQVP